MKKILAIILTAMMLMTIIPASVFAMTEPAEKPEEELPKKESAAELEGYLNSASTYIHYTNGSPGFTGQDNGSWKYIESSNAGTANSTATITSETFYMSVGEKLTFWYWYWTEANYDKFIMTDNGTQVFAYSGISGGSGSTPAWAEYTYTCSTSGNHTFVWKYQKDGSNDTGDDCVRMKDMSFDRHEKQYLARAASKEGKSGGFSFATSSNYPFEVKTNSNDSYHSLYVRSTNQGVANSDSTLYAYVYACEGWVLSFHYAVSGEQFYDKLHFKVDGTEVASFTPDDFSWYSHSYAFTSTGYHTLAFTYHKDGSNDSGADVACIDNIALDTSAGGYSDRRTYMNTFATSSLNVSTMPLVTPQDSQGYVPIMNSDSSNKRVRNNNRYLDNSDSTFELLVSMNMNETISFNYFVSCEATYDYFQFLVDDEEQMRASGWQENSWHSYTFTAPSNGTFVLTWKYHKDNSISRGWDYATVSGITYNGSYTQDLDDTLNVSGGNIHFTNGTVGFVEYNKYFHSAATAVNKYWEGSTASLIAANFTLHQGDVFRFMYYTDTEDGADYLSFYIKENSDSSYSFLASASGDSNGWQYYEYTATEDGLYSFKWVYEKDGTINDGEDRVFIDDVEIVRAGTPSAGNGDVDGNGTVNVTDAIMALRHAMGVITLNAAQIARGDVDGNGTVNVTDAVRIMRIAMGIS